MNSKKIVIAVVGFVVAVVVAVIYINTRPGQLDSFAQCLKDKGAVFYGAFWCPHCQNQKAMFGNSARKLPYVECSLPSGNGQTQVCIDKKIEGYPTWEFADGSRLTGEISLPTLAEKTGCSLPQP